MNHVHVSLSRHRSLRALGCSAFLAGVLAIASGCGSLGAMANPKVAWAASDPANMTIVVRRADAAASTATEVDRLLTSTPASADSDWMAKTGPAKDDASKHMRDVGELAPYKATKARVVASEVWVRTLPTVTSQTGQYPNVLAAIEPGLAASYAKIMAKKKEVAGLRALIVSEDAAADEKGISDAEKKGHQAKSKQIAKLADAADAEVAPLQAELIKTAKASASRATADVKGKFGVVIVNLRQAVDDAVIANGAAAVRYPMAVPGIKDATTAQVGVIVADILYEQTGKRPNLASFQPGVTFEGGTIGVALNGLTKDDIGKISATELTTETVKRTQSWFMHAAGLLGTIASTREVLTFEADVLDAVLDGFKAGGWSAPAPAIVDGSPGGASGGAGGFGGLTASVGK
jgi:hypothetical protein